MKSMKKAISILLALVLCLSLLPMSAFAYDNTSVTTSPTLGDVVMDVGGTATHYSYPRKGFFCNDGTLIATADMDQYGDCNTVVDRNVVVPVSQGYAGNYKYIQTTFRGVRGGSYTAGISTSIYVETNRNSSAVCPTCGTRWGTYTKGWNDWSDSWQVTVYDTFTMTFDANGGTGTTTLTERQAVSEYTFAPPQVTNGNKELKGWSTNPSATEADPNALTMQSPTNGGTKTVYAVWGNAETYTVTYTDGVMGETVFPDQGYEGLKAGDTTPEFIGTLTRQGYTFQGWAPAVAAQVTEDVTYVATWKKNCDHGNVDYTDNGDGTHDGVCSDCNETVVDDEAHTYKDGVCTKCGAEEAQDTTYTLTYVAQTAHKDEVQNLPTKQTETNKTGSCTFTIPSNPPTRANHTFLNWVGTGIYSGIYNPGGTVTLQAANPTLELTAYWTCNGTHVDKTGDGLCDNDNCDAVAISAPDKDDVVKLLNDAGSKITVDCVNANVSHADAEYDVIADSVTLGSLTPSGNSVICEVTVASAPYVDEYNKTLSGHTAKAETPASWTARLTYANKEWTATALTQTIQVECDAKNPDAAKEQVAYTVNLEYYMEKVEGAPFATYTVEQPLSAEEDTVITGAGLNTAHPNWAKWKSVMTYALRPQEIQFVYNSCDPAEGITLDKDSTNTITITLKYLHTHKDDEGGTDGKGDGFCDDCGENICDHTQGSDGFCDDPNCTHGSDCTCGGKRPEASNEVTITIRYVDGNGTQIGKDVSVTATKGEKYDVTADVKAPTGYELDGDLPENVKGEEAADGIVVTVKVKVETPDHTHVDKNGDGICDDPSCNHCMHNHGEDVCSDHWTLSGKHLCDNPNCLPPESLVKMTIDNGFGSVQSPTGQSRVVPYTVTVENNSGFALDGLDLTDLLTAEVYGVDANNNKVRDINTVNVTISDVKATIDGEPVVLAWNPDPNQELDNTEENTVNGDATKRGWIVLAKGNKLESGKPVKLTYTVTIQLTQGDYTGLANWRFNLKATAKYHSEVTAAALTPETSAPDGTAAHFTASWEAPRFFYGVDGEHSTDQDPNTPSTPNEPDNNHSTEISGDGGGFGDLNNGTQGGGGNQGGGDNQGGGNDSGDIYIPDDPTPLNPTPSTPNNPGEVEIDDERTPLASANGLNSVDHFAYIAGYTDGTVRPESNITRAEVATIFYRLMTDVYRAANWSDTNDFSDVNAGDWFNNAVSTCTKAGIVSGYSNGTFAPNQAITRAEFATIAARFLDEEITGENAEGFSDIDGHWAKANILRAAEAGWVNGDNGRFRPDNYITRAEVMTIVNRMLNRVPDEDHLLPEMKTWSDNPKTAWYYEAVQEATNEHAYEWIDENVENWTELLTIRDWAALEKEWATAYSAGN